MLKSIKINTEYITLGQLLKIVDLISSGGEAKFYLQENKVYVNDELESRRGRKLYSGYNVKIKDNLYMID